MSNPWMKFYPSDWRADPALRMCSIAARGLWMEMLCIMHEAEGYLTVNGRELLPRQLAGLAGASLEEVTSWLVELSDAGVFSRDANGTIFSRRMLKDIKRAAEDKANGRKGGNPAVKGGVNPPVNGGDGGGVKAQKLEARSQNLEPREEKKEDYQPGSPAAHLRVVDTPSGVDEDDSKYAFSAGIIKLLARDLDRWEKDFTAINVRSELHGMAEWAAKQGPNWFNAVRGHLSSKNRKAEDRKIKIAAEVAAGAQTARTKSFLERGRI